MSGSSKEIAPNSLDLINLLQKQDEVIVELYDELEICKEELRNMKETSMAAESDNQHILSSLHNQLSSLTFTSKSDQDSQAETRHQQQEKEEKQGFVPESSAMVPEADMNPEKQSNRKEIAEAVEKADIALSIAERVTQERDQLSQQLESAKQALSEALKDREKWTATASLNSARDACAAELDLCHRKIKLLTSEKTDLEVEMDDWRRKMNEMETQKQQANLIHRDSINKFNTEIKMLKDCLCQALAEKTKFEVLSAQLQENLISSNEINEKKVKMLEESGNKMKALMSSLDGQLNDTRDTWISQSKKCRQLEKQVWKLTEDNEVLRNNLQNQIQAFQWKVDQESRALTAVKDSETEDLKGLVLRQSELIDKLRNTCHNLTEQLHQESKDHSVQMKQLKRDKLELSKRLDQALQSDS